MIPKSITLDMVNSITKNNMLEHLGIRFTEIGDDYLVATMPVDHRTHQPLGLLHGGASAALIESLGSTGSFLMIDREKFSIVGIEVNANHVRGIKSGLVTAKGKVVHAGKTTHIWQVEITDENNKLVCTGRLTVLVVAKS